MLKSWSATGKMLASSHWQAYCRHPEWTWLKLQISVPAFPADSSFNALGTSPFRQIERTNNTNIFGHIHVDSTSLLALHVGPAVPGGLSSAASLYGSHCSIAGSAAGSAKPSFQGRCVNSHGVKLARIGNPEDSGDSAEAALHQGRWGTLSLSSPRRISVRCGAKGLGDQLAYRCLLIGMLTFSNCRCSLRFAALFISGSSGLYKVREASQSRSSTS